MSRCFSLSRRNLLVLPSLSGGVLVEFWPRCKDMDHPKCAFGLLGVILCEHRRPAEERCSGGVVQRRSSGGRSFDVVPHCEKWFLYVVVVVCVHS